MKKNERLLRGYKKLSEVDGKVGEEVVDNLGDLGNFSVPFSYAGFYINPFISRLIFQITPPF